MILNTNEHREFTRISVPLAVEIKPQGATSILSTTRNVSMSGLLLENDIQLDEHTSCQVALLLGDHGEVRIEASGTVARLDGSHVAIRFENVDLDGYMHLKNLIMLNSTSTDQIEGELAAHVGLKKK